MKQLLVLILIVHSFLLFGQSPYWIFDRLAIKEGLSNTYVSDIVKDSRGFIWIATTNGLNRYNTHEFEVFYADNENKNTISSDHVNCLLEDRSGRFWVGTDNGLNLYHPQSKTFTRYMPDSVDYENAKTQYISTLTEDCTGAIWVGTSRNGALRFNPETEVFDQPIPTVDTLNNSYYTSYVKCILIDTQQNVWIGTNGFGVLRYNPNTGDTKHWLHQQDGVTPNEMSYCFALYQDDEGEIWAGTFIGGLAKFIPETETFNLIPNPYNPNESIKNGVISINKNPDGGLILGTNGGGLFTFDPATLKFLKNYTFSSVNNHSVSDDFIGRIYIDNTGIIWLGTENGGLTYYDPNRRKFPLVEKKTIAGQELPLSIINTLYVDDNALIWIGTENSGFASYDPQKQTIKRFQMPHVQRKGGNTFVKCIVGDRHGGLWVGAQMGGLAHYTGEGVLIKQYSDELQPNDPFKLKDTDLNVICTGENEELWIGGLRGLTHKIGDRFINYCAAENIDNGNCSETVLALYNLNETHLLVGYQQDGLRIFNKKTKTFESHFTRENSDLSSDAIFCIREAKDGKIWIGTENGLNELSLVDSSIVSYTKVDGLPNAKIMAIEISESDELWISTAFGLSRFHPRTTTFTNYFESDGLQSNVFRIGASYRNSDGKLLFGGVRGFNFFDPTTIHSNPNSPPIVFTDFLLFNKSVIPGPTSPLSISIEKTNTIELSYEQSIISFSFVALNYTLPEKNEYAYRLEGFNKDWQYIGSRRYITFTNIPAGTYILTVKGCNNDGLWNEEGTSITLIIRPPFWETWWFRLLLILLTSGIIYGMYKLRIRSIKQQNRLLEAEVVVRTEQIVNQRNEIARQKELVEQKNHDITSSIRYAQRIQESTLPEISEMKSHFKDAFVFYRPKDIVSGDFYWFENTSNDNTILFAVADCTGHGVPGAMVSVLGNNGLNRSVNELGLEQPAEILNNLNLFIQRSFEKKDQTVQDGMDIALCQLNLKTKILLFSGANNSAWIARNNEMFVLSGTKQPIGNYRDSKSFDQTSFQLESEDWLFLFSDGYADQFGGPRGKKLKYALFNTILLNYDQTTDGDFEDYLSTSFDNWKGDLDQIDDVCVLGLKIR